MYYLFIIVIFYIYMYSIYNYVNEVYFIVDWCLLDDVGLFLGCFVWFYKSLGCYM